MAFLTPLLSQPLTSRGEVVTWTGWVCGSATSGWGVPACQQHGASWATSKWLKGPGPSHLGDNLLPAVRCLEVVRVGGRVCEVMYQHWGCRLWGVAGIWAAESWGSSGLLVPVAGP